MFTWLGMGDDPHALRTGKSRQGQRRGHAELKKGYGAVGIVVRRGVRPRVRRAMGLLAAETGGGWGVEGDVKPRVGLRRNREQPQR